MHDLVIVGGGAAALSAGVYAVGKQLDVVVIYEDLGGKAGTQQHLRGQSADEYLAGATAVRALEQQLAGYPQVTIHASVSEVLKAEGVFRTTSAQHGVFVSRAVIMATGAQPLPLDAPGARELLGHGLGYSATTHAHLVAGRPVAVIGSSIRALRGAAELARSAAKVYVITPDQAGLDTPLARALAQRPNVELLPGYYVKSVVGPFEVEALVIGQGDEHRRLRVGAAFVDLGLRPNSGPVRTLAQTDDEGFIWVDERNATSVPGLFAAGDVTTAFGEQILIAIGDGARAALSAYDYLLAMH